MGMLDATVNNRALLRAPFDLLADRLNAVRQGRRVVYMPNTGNFGDGLIDYGARRFFEDQGIDYLRLDMISPFDKGLCLALGAADRFLDRYLFVFGGGGAWCKAADHGFRYVRRQKALTDNLFLFPTTFEHHRMAFTFPAFARDRSESLDFLGSDVFCHDMAFYLALISPDRVLPDRVPPIRKFGLLMRTDVESSGHELGKHPRNYDISAQGSHLDDPTLFLRYIDQFEEVVTDRLHVAIGAALLGKKVTVIAGAYFKIRAIYQSSLRDLFDGVTFVETPTEALVRECDRALSVE